MRAEGRPDLVAGQYLGGVYGFSLTYSAIGLVAQIYASSDNELICVSEMKGPVRLHLVLTNPSSALPLYDATTSPPTDHRYWAPIAKLYGMDDDEFFQKISQGHNPCFAPLSTYP